MSEHWTIHQVAEELLNTFPRLGRLIEQYVQSVSKEESTLMQMGTLFFLIEQPATVSELAKKRKVSLQSTSVHVQSLVERGWVVRVPDETDRRRSLLEITPEGLAHAQTAKFKLNEYMADVLGGLTVEEFAAAQIFIPALRRIVSEQASFNVDSEQERA
jgi:DNA-binding MarR family transcriptional regulator